MRIAILTSGILPVPSVQGGAVENFLDYFLEYNNNKHLHDITVYSVYHSNTDRHPALLSECNKYIYIKTNSIWGKIKKRLYALTHKNAHYHYSIEYFLDCSIKHIKKCKYDIIILNNRPGYAEKLAKITSAKLVYNLYNDKLNSTTRANLFIYNAAALIITTSNYITERVKTINSNDNKCVTVYSGIELDRFTPNLTLKISRKDLNLPKDSFLLVFSGRVTQEKGIMELIEAMIKINNYKQISLLVIGSSFYGNATNDNNFTHKLKTRAALLKDRIKFTGFIPYSMVPHYLKISDIAIIPSIWDDPFPTTVLEAQAMGLPIITTCRGGIPEEVTEKNAIILNTDGDFINSLTDAILYLYNNPEKRAAMTKYSLERSALFNKETYAINFFKAIENGIQ